MQDEYVLPDDPSVPPPPLDEHGEIDWDAYYSDPRFWAAVRQAPRDKVVPVAPMPLAKRMSANGSVMAAMALGFREVFEGHKDKGEIIQVRDDAGDGDRPDKPFHLDFDPEDPENTRAIVRTWVDDTAIDGPPEDGSDDSDVRPA